MSVIFPCFRDSETDRRVAIHSYRGVQNGSAWFPVPPFLHDVPPTRSVDTHTSSSPGGGITRELFLSSSSFFFFFLGVGRHFASGLNRLFDIFIMRRSAVPLQPAGFQIRKYGVGVVGVGWGGGEWGRGGGRVGAEVG